METDSAGEYGHNLRVGCHLRGEEDNRYEHEQRAEHVHEVWNEIDIIVKDDSLERSFLLDKVIDSLADVEDDDDADDQKQRHEERAYELADYIFVKFPWSEIELHLIKVLSLFVLRFHPSMP